MMNWTGQVVVQGISQAVAAHYAPLMKAYGTKIVAGISAGGGGGKIQDIPIFDLVEEAMDQVGEVCLSLIFVEPYQVLDAASEAIAAGIKQIIITTAGVPPLDMVQLLQKAQVNHTFILGPGSGGMIIPAKTWLGRLVAEFYTPGHVGIISCTDTLSYEVALELNQAGLGQSIAVSLGKAGIICSTFVEWLPILETDPETKAIILIGQANGNYEQAAAEYLARRNKKPVIAYIPGIEFPGDGIRGDAATIIANQLSYSVPTNSTVKEKIATFQQANVLVAQRLGEIPELVKKVLKKS
ncbi:MAG: CoA-binding protein [Gomphosphaeria aponina SAG 52.96 = DSM 107014]|uniref:CoA-binding protein n=1 Tax=Gomphosphaeria aponina SAG 52.96 = DSM 107014 TaxID=1521640 RepID=A0A941JMN7_9CHRO|nr:CoA-binding protein [Gomphosphaeria aponina SAG 52.96 = DSM 107014]